MHDSTIPLSPNTALIELETDPDIVAISSGELLATNALGIARLMAQALTWDDTIRCGDDFRAEVNARVEKSIREAILFAVLFVRFLLHSCWLQKKTFNSNNQMRRYFSSKFIGQPTFLTHPELLSSSQLIRGIEKGEFANRRQKLCEQLVNDEQTCVIFTSNEEKYFSHDTSYVFRQNSTFSYLFGFLEPHAVALLLPQTNQFYLFCRPHDPVKEMWEGPICGPERAISIFGCDDAFSIRELEQKLPTLLPKQEPNHKSPVLVATDPHFAQQVDTVLNQKLRQLCPASTIESARSVLKTIDAHRMIKSEAELHVIREACKVSGQGHTRAMNARLQLTTERAMQMEVEYGFQQAEPFYSTIVAGGPRACTLHYTANDMKFSPGLCLIDAGGKLLGTGYGGDISRTFPVLRAKFSTPERDVYELVLEVMESVLGQVRDGVTFQHLQEHTLNTFQSRLSTLLSRPITGDQVKKYFPHGVGHFLGLDVHDTPTIPRTVPLRANTVITIEPGLYFPENDLEVPKELRGIGIRIEDNVAVTLNGNQCENMTRPYVPVLANDIERLG